MQNLQRRKRKEQARQEAAAKKAVVQEPSELELIAQEAAALGKATEQESVTVPKAVTERKAVKATVVEVVEEPLAEEAAAEQETAEQEATEQETANEQKTVKQEAAVKEKAAKKKVARQKPEKPKKELSREEMQKKKKKQRVICLSMIAIILICIVIAAFMGKPETREFSASAVVGEAIDKSFSVEHEFENCEFGIADRKDDSFQEYGLTLFVDSTGISVTGIPNKVGTAVSTAYYKNESKTVYVRVKVNIGNNDEENYDIKEFNGVAKVNEELLMKVDVDHDFEACTFHESEDGRDNYREFGLNLYMASDGLMLVGTPTKTGVVRASAVYTSDKADVQPYMAVITLTITEDGKSAKEGEDSEAKDTEKTLDYAVELTVGESAEMVLPVEYGLTDCQYEEAADKENTYAEYGLTITPSAEGIAFSGKPAKTGEAVYTMCCSTETEKVYVQVKISMVDNGQGGTESFSAVAGEPFAQMIYFSEFGIDASKCQVKPAEESANSLSDFNLTADYGYESVTIEGTPTQGGTATVTMEVLEEGEESRTVSFDINITVPERVTIAVNGKVGEALDSVTELNSDDYQAEAVGEWQDQLSEVGLEAICNGKQLTIKGTPTAAGKYYAYFNLILDNQLTYLIAEINIEDAESIVLTSRTVDGKVTLYTDIPLSGDYTFSLYRNSIRSTVGAKAASGYDTHPASERTHSIGLNFKKLNRPVYYFYIVAKQGDKVLTSDYVRVVNPDVQTSASNPFTDVSKDNPNAEEILYAVNSGLISGASADTFQSDDVLTVAEAIKLASCLHEYYMTGAITLTDAESGAWYMSYADYAVENGIISEKQFTGIYGDPISKADFVRLFAAVMPSYEYNEINEVADGSIEGVDVQQIYAEDVYTLARAGILDGSEAFSAADGMQRGEAAVVIARMANPALRLVK